MNATEAPARKGDPYVLIEVQKHTVTTRVIGKVSRPTWLAWFRLAKRNGSDPDEVGGFVVERFPVEKLDEFVEGLSPLGLRVEVRKP